MKYPLFFLLLLLIALPATAQEAALNRVLQSGEIKCGYAPSPPSLVIDPNTGDISGLNVEIWEEIGKELDLKITWAEEAGWGNYIEGLNTGRYDVFCSQVWPDPGRIKNSTMIGPVIYQTLMAYVRRDDNRFDGNLDRINQPDIGIPAIDGDVGFTMAKSKFPQARIETLPQMANVGDMFMSVVSKKSDVIFLDETFYNVLAKENPDVLKIVPDAPPVFVYGSYFSVKRGEYGLKDMIAIALRRMIDDGRMKDLAHKYSDAYYIPLQNYKMEK